MGQAATKKGEQTAVRGDPESMRRWPQTTPAATPCPALMPAPLPSPGPRPGSPAQWPACGTCVQPCRAPRPGAKGNTTLTPPPGLGIEGEDSDPPVRTCTRRTPAPVHSVVHAAHGGDCTPRTAPTPRTVHGALASGLAPSSQSVFSGKIDMSFQDAMMDGDLIAPEMLPLAMSVYSEPGFFDVCPVPLLASSHTSLHSLFGHAHTAFDCGTGWAPWRGGGWHVAPFQCIPAPSPGGHRAAVLWCWQAAVASAVPGSRVTSRNPSTDFTATHHRATTLHTCCGHAGGTTIELRHTPATAPWRQVPASTAFVTDSNRPQPLWQPPPTAYIAASEVPSRPMHPWWGDWGTSFQHCALCRPVGVTLFSIAPAHVCIAPAPCGLIGALAPGSNPPPPWRPEDLTSISVLAHALAPP